MRYKELTIGIVIAVILVLGFVFRGKIFHAPPVFQQDNSVQTEQSTPNADIGSQDQKTPQNNNQATTTTKVQPVPAYHGRRLDEIRISTEMADSLSTQQKTKIIADIHTYAKMTQDTPGYIAAWLQLAILKKGIGDYEGSRDIWVYVTVLRPHEITAFLNLGDLHTNYLKDYPKAEQYLRTAIQVNPKEEMAYIRLSQLYWFFYKEKAGMAEQVLQEGLAANPGNVNLSKELVDLQGRKAKQ